MEHQPNKLHGNSAKVDPEQHIESEYATNSVTRSARRKNGVPFLTSQEDVEYAKKFVEENKK